jgi:16S rRNA (cytidine1402-2'-O)-methyltransferase
MPVGTLYIVATPIGNLEDITYRAVQILAAVDLIAAEDTRVTKVLLDRYGISKPMISYFARNEKYRAQQLIERLLGGESVALVSDAGMPGISDPAHEIVREAIEHAVPLVPIPGPTAFVSALVISGFQTHSFVFEGFLPQKKGRKTKLETLSKESRTIVLYESPHRIQRTLRDLQNFFPGRSMVVARELTKKFEEIVRGPIERVAKELSSKSPRGEYVLVIEGLRKMRD